MSNGTDLEIRPCYLCDKPVPSAMHDYGRMTRYKCPDCGDYEISSMAKDTLTDSKVSVQKIVKDAKKKLSEDEIISISTKAIKVDKR